MLVLHVFLTPESQHQISRAHSWYVHSACREIASPCDDGIDCENLVLLGCNDDTEGCEGWISYLQIKVLAGGEYLLRVGGWQEDSVGTGLLSIEHISD